MKTFEFAIVATGLPVDTDEWEYAFFEAGCDDATVSLQRGVYILHFDRDADTFEQAMRSACRDVCDAGATVLRIEPDPLVSSSDIAERAGITRQAASLYTTGGRGDGFPLPVACVTGSRTLWRWADVAQWLHGRGKLSTDALEHAHLIHALNLEYGERTMVSAAEAGRASTAGARPFTRYEDYTHAGQSKKTPAPGKAKFREGSRQRRPFVLRPEAIAA